MRRIACAAILKPVEEHGQLADVFEAFWAPLTPLQRAAFINGIASMFRGVQVPPRPIYHYTSPNGFANIVTNCEIWATNAGYLNDAGELSYPTQLAQMVLRDLSNAERDSEMRLFIAGVARSVEEHAIYKAWYLASFSSRGNLLSQWRAYCPQGGYSLGFEPATLSQIIKRSRLLLGPVVYRESAQIAAIRKVVNDQLDVIREIRSKSADRAKAHLSRESQLSLALTLGEVLIFFKSSAFREEREWRVAMLDILGEATKRFRDRRGVLTPYVVLPLRDENSRLPLSCVNVSPLGDAQLAADAAELCLQAADYPNANAIIRSPTFGLRFV